MKKCFKCGEMKPFSEFYKHPQMADGRVNKCKSCNKKDVSENYRANIEHYKEYEKERMRLPHRKAAVKKYAQENPDVIKKVRKTYQAKWPLKKIAHYLTSNAIRNKRIIKKPCIVCGELKVEAHHEDYYKPLEVQWLCRKHHLEAHGKVSKAMP